MAHRAVQKNLAAKSLPAHQTKGSYPMLIEAPLFGNTYEFDNRYRLPGEIVIR
jgi:hypothetical protein